MNFDSFAETAAKFVSRAPFFAFCVLVILLWAPSFLVVPNIDTWQLIINTFTTIVTFLLVALLQNTQARSEKALQTKLNAIANALADLMEANSSQDEDLAHDTKDLRHAVGIEEEITTKKGDAG